MQRQEYFKFKASTGKVSEILSQKQNTNKRAGSMTQVVEGLLSKLKALSSNPRNLR
jgi:hypothetical protein